MPPLVQGDNNRNLNEKMRQENRRGRHPGAPCACPHAAPPAAARRRDIGHDHEPRADQRPADDTTRGRGRPGKRRAGQRFVVVIDPVGRRVYETRQVERTDLSAPAPEPQPAAAGTES